MAVTLTVGENTYATLAQANTYMATRLGSAAWSGASDDDKSIALVTAFKRIEKLVFVGAPTSTSQKAKWPRSGILNPISGEDYPSDGMPAFLQEAQAEEALYLLQNRVSAAGSSLREQLQAQRVKKVTIGNTTEEYDLSIKPEAIAGAICKQAMTSLSPYLQRFTNVGWGYNS